MGGGGLERQMHLTAEALRRRGHAVGFVHEMSVDDKFDVLHAIGNGTDIWQNLQHWRRNRTPLVSSPVIVCSPGATEIKLQIGARLGRIPNVNSMSRDILRAADHVIALTEYERSLVFKLAGKDKPVDVIDNGVDRVDPAEEAIAESAGPYVAMLGSISARKRQLDVLRAVGDAFNFVVVGGVEGSETERAEWKSVVGSTGAEWLGEIHDPRLVARTLGDASALVLMSRAEVQSLAVLEALAYGTPVVASAIPSHEELATRFPGWVLTVTKTEQIGPALQQLIDEPPTARPQVPSWDDVAEKIEVVYERVLASTAS